ncbi:type II CAAX endopeptidase family protein [Pseudoalteromonas sp. YIC-827]|uniref:Type II CAAX endopeptidase family protein n=2 Tax=Pseudoalteromonas TaxID=53246 RepID=A0ABU9MWC2_9GAMM
MVKLVLESLFVVFLSFLGVFVVYLLKPGAHDYFYSSAIYFSMSVFIFFKMGRVKILGWGESPFNFEGFKWLVICLFSLLFIDSFYNKSCYFFELACSINDSGGEVLGLIFTLILAPVVEELLFRGVIFNHFKSSVGIVKSATVSSLSFSIIHFGMGAYELMVMFFSGFVFCYLVGRFRNGIYYSITLHFLINFISLF